MVLPNISRLFNLVLVLVPNNINVRSTVRLDAFASFTHAPNENRYLCDFYEKDAGHALYPCGPKDFLTTF